MTAEIIARALGGRKVGTGWIACCPAHHDRDPSLSICDADGKVLVLGHAGCAQHDVIAALKARGLWDSRVRSTVRRLFHCKAPHTHPDQRQQRRSKAALRIWQSTILATKTPVEAYLAARGLTGPIPPRLRFHPALEHPSGGIWPTMVALVTRGTDDEPLAIHRTFLTRDGAGKAPVDPAKMMLGPCRGGAVRLEMAGDVLLVGEGLETCLDGHAGDRPPGLGGPLDLRTPGARSPPHCT